MILAWLINGKDSVGSIYRMQHDFAINLNKDIKRKIKKEGKRKAHIQIGFSINPP